MIAYRIVIMKPARKYIKRQSRPNRERLLRAIYQLPYTGDIKPVSGQENVFRLRVGNFRVIYSVFSTVLTVEVMDADTRGDVYK